MQTNEFQLTFSSNNSVSIYPDNKPQSFKIRLPAPIDLVGDWEVALMQIQYPRSWFTIQESHEIRFAKCTFKNNRENIYDTPCSPKLSDQSNSAHDLATLYNLFGESESKIEEYYVNIEPGFYPSPASVLWRLDELIREQYFKCSERPDDSLFPINLYYDEIENKCKFKGSDNWAWCLPKESTLFRELGIIIDHDDTDWKKFPMTGAMANMKTWSRIYVYTDIIKPQLVGDAHLPLIAVAPVNGESGCTSAHWNFLPPYYLPVSRTYINDIEFQIKSEFGDFVPFRNGIVINRLHFRRRL